MDIEKIKSQFSQLRKEAAAVLGMLDVFAFPDEEQVNSMMEGLQNLKGLQQQSAVELQQLIGGEYKLYSSLTDMENILVEYQAQKTQEKVEEIKKIFRTFLLVSTQDKELEKEITPYREEAKYGMEKAAELDFNADVYPFQAFSEILKTEEGFARWQAVNEKRAVLESKFSGGILYALSTDKFFIKEELVELQDAGVRESVVEETKLVDETPTEELPIEETATAVEVLEEEQIIERPTSKERGGFLWAEVARNADTFSYKKFCGEFFESNRNGNKNLIRIPECILLKHLAMYLGLHTYESASCVDDVEEKHIEWLIEKGYVDCIQTKKCGKVLVISTKAKEMYLNDNARKLLRGLPDKNACQSSLLTLNDYIEHLGDLPNALWERLALAEFLGACAGNYEEAFGGKTNTDRFYSGMLNEKEGSAVLVVAGKKRLTDEEKAEIEIENKNVVSVYVCLENTPMGWKFTAEDDYGNNFSFVTSDEDILDRADEFLLACKKHLQEVPGKQEPIAIASDVVIEKDTEECVREGAGTDAQEELLEVQNAIESQGVEESTLESKPVQDEQIEEAQEEPAQKQVVEEFSEEELPAAVEQTEQEVVAAKTEGVEIAEREIVEESTEEVSSTQMDTTSLEGYNAQNDALYKEKIEKLIAERRGFVALTLLHALGEYSGEYKKWETRLAYVLGANIRNQEEDRFKMVENFAEYSSGTDEYTYKVCAYLRSLVMNNLDYTLLSEMKPMLADRSGYWENRAEFKEAFNACMYAVERAKGCNGFTKTLIAALNSKGREREIREKHIKKAKILISEISWKPRDPSPIFPVAFKAAFDKGNLIYDALAVIAAGDTSQEAIETVRKAEDYFYSNGKLEDRIYEYKEDAWRVAKAVKSNGKKNSVLKSSIETNFKAKLVERLELIVAFLENIDSAMAFAQKDLDMLSGERGKMLSRVEKAIQEYTYRGTSDAAIIEKTLRDIRSYLNGESFTDRSKWNYKEFIASPYIEMEAGTLVPIVANKYAVVCGMELLNRILRHIQETNLDITVACAERCLKTEDYGKFDMACEYLTEQEELSQEDQARIQELDKDLDQACERANKSADNEERGLKAELEMEYMRGAIDDVFQSQNQKILSFAIERSKETNNHALRKILFQRMRENIRFKREEVKAQLREQYQELCERYRDELEEDEQRRITIEKIGEQIDAGNCNVAEEYLAVFRLGKELHLSGNLDDVDYHKEFLASYAECERICKKVEDRALSSITSNLKKEFKGLLGENIAANVERGASALLRAFFANARECLELLGFSVKADLGGEINDQREKLKVKGVFEINPTPCGIEMYEHPIKQFGTGLSKLTVLTISGKGAEKELHNTLKKFLSRCGDVNIVFHDVAISETNRRLLAKNMRVLDDTKTFLVVDRTLCVYLASLRKEVRLNALLRCTLPYAPFNSSVNPYNENGAGIPSDEMFIGREEYRSAMTSMGNNRALIYGGRQLGKSALIERSRNILHKPQDKSFAYSCCIKDAKSDKILQEFVYRMKLDNILREEDSIEDWDEFRKTIVKLYKDKVFSRLSLFIDEADAFVLEEYENGYPVLNILNTLQRDTQKGGEFKFIIAGLHNLARKKQINNSPVGQLGSPMVIRPFSQKEARQLVERPLQYFGYYFEDTERQLPVILSHTNYYPGLLHLFCSKLLKHLSDNYSRYFNAKNPPCYITDQHISDVIEASEFNGEVREKFLLTVQGLDKRYEAIALVLCALYTDEHTATQGGYTASQIIDWCQEYGCSTLADEGLQMVEALLDEMVDLGVLLKTNDKQASPHYMFLRHIFYSYVCGSVSNDAKGEDLILLIAEKVEKI